MYRSIGSILAILLAAYVIVFFVRYFLSFREKPNSTEWISRRKKDKFTMELTRHPLGKKEWIWLGIVTAVYAVVAFVYLGGFKAPQSFFRFTPGAAVTVELSEPETLAEIGYYTGLFHDETGYTLEVSADGVYWHTLGGMSQEHGETFQWRAVKVDAGIGAVRYIKISVPRRLEFGSLELGELAIRALKNGETRLVSGAGVLAPGAEALFDEQDIIPEKYHILNSTHFDEIYHARTAYEHLRGIYPYEITHPPLGKYIIGIGIRIFGMTPFGWRCMGALFGVLMVPVFFVLVHNMFGKRLVSVSATLIFAFDFMHFVQTRIATIDVYGVFFILLMYFFMYRYISAGLDAPFGKTAPWLILCGLSFGVGIAAKWISAYAGLGLLVIYLFYLYKRYRFTRRQEKAFSGYLLATLAVSLAAFVIVPGAVYVACYIPYAQAKFGEVTLSGVWTEFLSNQKYMLNYHGVSVIGSTHGFSSKWYQWIFDLRPILYYVDYGVEVKASISAFSSPLVAWAGLVSLAGCVYGFIRTRSFVPLFILIGYLSQLLPWIGIQRTTFSYHYFPSLVFCVLAIAYIFSSYPKEARPKRQIVAFTAVALALFVMFYPALAGVNAPSWYYANVLQWFINWQI